MNLLTCAKAVDPRLHYMTTSPDPFLKDLKKEIAGTCEQIHTIKIAICSLNLFKLENA